LITAAPNPILDRHIHEFAMPGSPGSAPRPPLFLGIDVGGTNIKLGLVDDAGQTLAHTSIATDEQRGAENGCRRIGQAALQLAAEAGAAAGSVVRAGLVTPGPIDVPRGLVLRPGNIPGWWDFPIRERASHHVGVPVTFNNDANAAAYGEFWRGAGAQFQSMILLTLGTGVGGGIIIGDMLIDGMHSCGGECGHILVDSGDDAPRDSLGKSGSLESYCNASALVARVRAALNAGEASTLAHMPAHGELTPLVIAEEAENGDSLAKRAIMDTAHWLAMGIVSLVHTIDPDAVVLAAGPRVFATDSQRSAAAVA
jgi:glucokinase